jgi:hypothetical protein
MELKLGRYKFKQCRHSGYSKGHLFTCHCPDRCVGIGHVELLLQSRRNCDTCEHFDPLDKLGYFVGLPEEKKSQENYNKRRRR